MAGKAIVRVELADGSIVQRELAWTGGNPAFDAWEAAGAIEVLGKLVRAQITAINGDAKRGER